MKSRYHDSHALNGDVPLDGFSGSPWTTRQLHASKRFRKDSSFISKAMMYQSPETLHALLDKLAKSVTAILMVKF